MSRLLAYGFGLTLVAAVAAKACEEPRVGDSYPLSTYPMFARARGKPLLHFMEGVDGSGATVRLEPELIATEEVMQAAATVRRAAQSGQPAMRRLCERVAGRVAKSAAHGKVAVVRLVAARFDPLAYFSVTPEPESRVERYRCNVPRSP